MTQNVCAIPGVVDLFARTSPLGRLATALILPCDRPLIRSLLRDCQFSASQHQR